MDLRIQDAGGSYHFFCFLRLYLTLLQLLLLRDGLRTRTQCPTTQVCGVNAEVGMTSGTANLSWNSVSFILRGENNDPLNSPNHSDKENKCVAYVFRHGFRDYSADSYRAEDHN